MKLLSVLLSVGLFIMTSAAQADYSIVNCQSVQGTGRSFALFITNQNLIQLRMRVNSHRSRAFVPVKNENQNIEGVTQYAISGMTGLLEVDNQILSGNGGLVRLGGDEFSCL